jgi:shikimate dehydrogenase
MQNAGIGELGLDWRYVAFETHPDDLKAAIEGARAMRYIGLNLTVPHKLLAVDLMDELDESARTWGAVNTVVFEGRGASGEWRPLGQWAGGPIEEVRTRGYNTDADAITRSLREDLDCEPKGSQVLLLGAGGAGRVAALKLAAEGVDRLWLVNRTESKAAQLAEEIRAAHPTVEALVGYPSTDNKLDLILNATSLGLKPDDPSPLDASRFPICQARAVFDMVYRPDRTALLQAAQSADCRIADGTGMLLWQGVKALEIWSGKRAPADAMRAALQRHLRNA